MFALAAVAVIALAWGKKRSTSCPERTPSREDAQIVSSIVRSERDFSLKLSALAPDSKIEEIDVLHVAVPPATWNVNGFETLEQLRQGGTIMEITRCMIFNEPLPSFERIQQDQMDARDSDPSILNSLPADDHRRTAHATLMRDVLTKSQVEAVRHTRKIFTEPFRRSNDSIESRFRLTVAPNERAFSTILSKHSARILVITGHDLDCLKFLTPEAVVELVSKHQDIKAVFFLVCNSIEFASECTAALPRVAWFGFGCSPLKQDSWIVPCDFIWIYELLRMRDINWIFDQYFGKDPSNILGLYDLILKINENRASWSQSPAIPTPGESQGPATPTLGESQGPDTPTLGEDCCLGITQPVRVDDVVGDEKSDTWEKAYPIWPTRRIPQSAKLVLRELVTYACADKQEKEKLVKPDGFREFMNYEKRLPVLDGGKYYEAYVNGEKGPYRVVVAVVDDAVTARYFSPSHYGDRLQRGDRLPKDSDAKGEKKPNTAGAFQQVLH